MGQQQLESVSAAGLGAPRADSEAAGRRRGGPVLALARWDDRVITGGHGDHRVTGWALSHPSPGRPGKAAGHWHRDAGRPGGPGMVTHCAGPRLLSIELELECRCRG